MRKSLSPRTFQEVFHDHLQLSESGDYESDIARNFSEDLVILFENEVYRGHAGARHLAKRLESEIPKAKFQNRMILIDKEIGMLEWTAQSEKFEVLDGVDSYSFRDGKIYAQTIHYTVTRRTDP